MAQRLELHATLVDLLGLGSDHVYFQPPPNTQINYPCIIYSIDQKPTDFADGLPYLRRRRYEVKVIDPNPDSSIPDKIAALPTCVFDRHYTADGLHHEVYKLFF